MREKKGQASLEVILAITVLLMMLLLVYMTAGIKNSQTELLGQTHAYESQCNKIALSISNVYSAGPRSKLLLEIEYDAFVGDNNVTLLEDGSVLTYCDFPAKAQAAQLDAGTVEAKNIAGIVVLSNA